MSGNGLNIALLMMVKNESKRILTSLESVLGTVKSVIIYDTGSEDNTLDLIEKFCKKNKLELHIKKGEFVDFSTSRNVSLEFAEQFKHINYLLLLDGNDELKEGLYLKKMAHKLLKSEQNGFMISQEWKNPDGSLTKYYNIRFIKNNCKWRYKGSVHEYIESDIGVMGKIEKVVLFQDRKYDAEKSMGRYIKDKEFLMKDYISNPKEPRTLFYLAQTCSCLGQNDESFQYYLERTQVEGFYEERFHSFMRMGELGEKLDKNWDELLKYYLEAYNIIERAEPLVKIAEYYRSLQKWNLAFLYCKKACDLDFPKECNLFIDRYLYDYYRWHLLGIVSYYANKLGEGKEGCLKALRTKPDSEIDRSNLKFYIKN